jgi:hypothetical protein
MEEKPKFKKAEEELTAPLPSVPELTNILNDVMVE